MPAWNRSLRFKQPEREYVGFCRDRNVLLAVHHIRCRRGEQVAARRKVPQVLPGFSIQCNEVAVVIACEYDATRGGDGTRPHDARARHRILPLEVAAQHIERSEKELARL